MKPRIPVSCQNTFCIKYLLFYSAKHSRLGDNFHPELFQHEKHVPHYTSHILELGVSVRMLRGEETCGRWIWWKIIRLHWLQPPRWTEKWAGSFSWKQETIKWSHSTYLIFSACGHFPCPCSAVLRHTGHGNLEDTLGLGNKVTAPQNPAPAHKC